VKKHPNWKNRNLSPLFLIDFSLTHFIWLTDAFLCNHSSNWDQWLSPFVTLCLNILCSMMSNIISLIVFVLCMTHFPVFAYTFSMVCNCLQVRIIIKYSTSFSNDLVIAIICLVILTHFMYIRASIAPSWQFTSITVVCWFHLAWSQV